MDRFNVQSITINASGNSGLRLAVQVFTPKHTPKPRLNILLSHANGYHKELWYPIIAQLANINARFIAYDIRNQGDSALLNAGKLEKEKFSWLQNVDDILTVVDALQLQAPIMAVGHSIGGACVLIAEHKRPNTFVRIISLDPVCGPLSVDDPMYAAGIDVVVGKSAKRRSRWANRDEAKAAFVKRPFFQSWEEEMLDLHIKYGLFDDAATGEVVLKCTPQEEVNTFIGNQNASRLAYDCLPELKCPVLFIGGLDSDYNPAGNTEGNAERCVYGELLMLENTGHLVPMEKPLAVVGEIKRYAAAAISLPGKL
ncbi:Alpha/Beta hydrolase protein [Thamnocephalis sphaerospora]|uniref:Alpha/Beta hydrolase protein n=1 Tax=Thamnocephalis sphaerospora TaxID=78915 RepID=A0A4V1IWC9_9FUNG|nr:Alpha/Beta hydrolase protein [Thamnocephalis sphaerospora]|eukprot:RKP07119.1 Alpha/Beta hydrolase protein [Thamnocephalis sphaerospora]